MSEYIAKAKLETGELWERMDDVGKQNAVVRQMRDDMKAYADELERAAATAKTLGGGIFKGKELSEDAQNWLIEGKLTDALNDAKKNDKDFYNSKIN
mgnify:CR=1 FL=1